MEEEVETPDLAWQRDTFYVTLDTICCSLEDRLGKNKPLLQSLAIFAPQRFYQGLRCKTAESLELCIREFCNIYRIDSSRCADELLSFSKAFCKIIAHSKEDLEMVSDGSEEQSQSDEEDEETDKEADSSDEQYAKQEGKKNLISFTAALRVLSNDQYHLIDAYPELCKAYAIPVAIPISSASCERSFSALKRVKTRIRSSMVQERLEGLLLMAVEQMILLSLNKDRLIDLFAKLSSELSKALL